MGLNKNLEKWRKDRNINTHDTKGYIANVLEELLEICYDNKDEIKEMQRIIMRFYFNREPLGESNTIDAIQDIQVFSINEVENMGYNNRLCNEEVFKHISCRKQDPIQFLEWRENNPKGKWKKWEDQPKKELYEPDYESCKYKDKND